MSCFRPSRRRRRHRRWGMERSSSALLCLSVVITLFFFAPAFIRSSSILRVFISRSPLLPHSQCGRKLRLTLHYVTHTHTHTHIDVHFYWCSFLLMLSIQFISSMTCHVSLLTRTLTHPHTPTHPCTPTHWRTQLTLLVWCSFNALGCSGMLWDLHTQIHTHMPLHTHTLKLVHTWC